MKHSLLPFFGGFLASLAPFRGVSSQFVTRNGVNLELDGVDFNFAGTNIYDGKDDRRTPLPS